MNKTTEFSSHFKLILHVVNLYEEGYNLFGVRISIMNHSNSYVDIVLVFFASIEGKPNYERYYAVNEITLFCIPHTVLPVCSV